MLICLNLYANTAVRVSTLLESSNIVFVNSTTEVQSDWVAVVIFASARVYYCCIWVKIAALPCVACTFAAYTLFLDVLDNLWNSLKALKLLQVFLSLCFWENYRQSSWYSPHFSRFVYAIETILAGVYKFSLLLILDSTQFFNKLLKEGFAWNRLLHFPIDLLYVFIFKFYVPADEVS